MPDVLQTSFSGGEFSPDLYGRTDISRYATGAKLLRNFFVHTHGGISNRQGTEFVCKAQGVTRIIPFQFSVEQTYVLEFSNNALRFVANGGQVVESAKTITGVSLVNPLQLTITSHGYTTGDEVYIDDVGGTDENNGRNYVITVIDPNTISLNGIDGSGFTAYTSGGTAERVYEIVSPYAEADLWTIKYTQSADVMTLTCKGYDAYELKRLGNTNWTLTKLQYFPEIASPTSLTASTSSAGSITYRYKVTAVDTEGKQESMPATISATKTITAITKANPAVVTSTSHGYVAGDEIYISGVVGMTEINGRYYRVGTTTTNTFELRDVDSTNYTTYTSGGSANRTHIDIASNALSTAGLTITLTWAAVTGASIYRVYREQSGIYGYIGNADGLEFKDNNIQPQFSDTPPRYALPYDVNEYPAVVEYFEQRLCFARVQTIKTSRTGSFKNFSVSIPSKDDDALTLTLNATQVNEIRWLIPLNELIVMTSGGTWKISGAQGALSPSSAIAKRQGSYRVNDVKPVLIGNQVIYASGRTVRDLAYTFELDAYAGKSLSVIASHLFQDTDIKEWAFQQIPNNLLWVVMNNGEGRILTYVNDLELFAWTRFDTLGTIESVCTVPEDDIDAVYFVVKRNIDGQDVRYVERLARRDFNTVEDAYFVDCGLTYDGAETDYVGGLHHLEGEEVSILADGNVVTGKTVVDGGVELDFTAEKIHVGLPYKAQMQSLSVVAGQNDGTSQGRKKNIYEVVIKVKDTRGLWVGYDENSLYEIKQRFNEDWNDPIALKSGDFVMPIESKWQEEAEVFIEQPYPLPCTIVTLIPRVKVGS